MKLDRFVDMLGELSAWYRLAAPDRAALRSAAFGLAVGCLLCGGLWGWQRVHLNDAWRLLLRAKADATEENAKAHALMRAASPLPASWWGLLPSESAIAHSGPDSLTSVAMVAAKDLHIRIVRMSFSALPRTGGAPYSAVAVQVELRGAYSDLKRWLDEVLSRRPRALVLRSIDLRRAAENAAQPSVEASVELRLFERIDPSRSTGPR